MERKGFVTPPPPPTHTHTHTHTPACTSVASRITHNERGGGGQPLSRTMACTPSPRSLCIIRSLRLYLPVTPINHTIHIKTYFPVLCKENKAGQYMFILLLEWRIHNYRKGTSIRQEPVFGTSEHYVTYPWKFINWMNELYIHCLLLVSYIQQYFNISITVLTNQVWKLLIALFKVPNTGAFTVCDYFSITLPWNNLWKILLCICVYMYLPFCFCCRFFLENFEELVHLFMIYTGILYHQAGGGIPPPPLGSEKRCCCFFVCAMFIWVFLLLLLLLFCFSERLVM